MFYTLKLWHGVQILRFLDEIKERLPQSSWRPADKSAPPRPLLLNWPHLILCTVQFNYLSRNCVRETETFHATSCGLPSLRCSLFDLLEFELECMMRMNPILYGHLQRKLKKLIGSYHGPCDPGYFCPDARYKNNSTDVYHVRYMTGMRNIALDQGRAWEHLVNLKL